MVMTRKSVLGMSGKGRLPGKPSDHKKVSWEPGQKIFYRFSLGVKAGLNKNELSIPQSILHNRTEYTVKKIWKGETAELVFLEEIERDQGWDLGFRVELFEEVKDD
tara:strand:+ start:17 stop:334 length:318 start_codon:yes stop_codon:yes gene_type:complete